MPKYDQDFKLMRIRLSDEGKPLPSVPGVQKVTLKRYVNNWRLLLGRMGGKGLDNSIMESFFGIVKSEMFYGHEREFRNFAAFSEVVGEYIRYYNCVRVKRKTGWKSPVEYRLEQGFAT